jgi:hypothetical protein
MKRYLFFVALFLSVGIFYPACCDDDDPGYCSEKGIILEVDYRECACCGGWFIEIGNDTLRAVDLPFEFQQSLSNDEYPLPVYLEWSPMEDPCLGDEIGVECIRRRE